MAGAIIQEGSTWRYFKGNSTPPAAWTNVTYNDTGVFGGPSPSGLGYGDGDDATVFGDMQNNYVSLFIRKIFTIADTSAVTHLTLAADYDDGFIAYLNGQEVARQGLPAGVVSHLTTATNVHAPSREGIMVYSTLIHPSEKEFFTLDPGLLTAGSNVLAVSGHNASFGSTDFSLMIELYTNVTLVRGPLLSIQHNGQITVSWRTDALTDSIVDVGPDQNYGEVSVAIGTPVRQHVVELPPLPAGSNYFYRVRSGGVTLAESTFRSPPQGNQPFRFAVIGDFGCGTPASFEIARRVDAANPDLNITVGDNIYYSGQPGSFDPWWFIPYSNVVRRVPVMPALGNHDDAVENGRWTVENFSLPTNGPAGQLEKNYSFDYGNAHFATFDSSPFEDNDLATMTAITNWLEQDLAQTTQAWKFVMYHEPPYTSLGSHDDESDVKTRIVPILERHGVQFAWQGHNHFYERINPINGVHYITAGGGGQGLYPITTRREYSAAEVDDIHTCVIVEIDGPRLGLRCIDTNGVVRDDYRYDLDHAFTMDGLLDSTNWVRAAHGLRLNAAIRGYHLYLATQDAGEGSDHFMYVNNMPSNSVAMNWSKSGQIMQWGAFLADENNGGFCSWFGPQQQVRTNDAIYRAMTSGLDDNGVYSNGVLEGTLELVQQFGAFPQQLYLAAAPFTTTNGGFLIQSAQVPIGNGDGSIQSNEFLAVNPRDIALDLPVAAAVAGTNTEAGMWVALDGTTSTASSGLPLTFVWMQLEGAPGVISNASAVQTWFRLTNDVAAATNVVLQLTVNDTRFDSNATVSILITPLADTDGDGLSDAEEMTGVDNGLTTSDPNGNVTQPADADSDDDGMNDGDEAFAGTNPNDDSSVLEILGLQQLVATNFVLQWSSESGRTYRLNRTTNLWVAPQPVVSNIPATAPMNTHTVELEGVPAVFYDVEVEL